MDKELKQIKKLYGEEMMHLCRDLFPSVLEQEGKLLKILTEHLAPTHSFAKDVKENCLVEDFEQWINSYVEKNDKPSMQTNKTPFELMREAGYTLYECHSEKEIQYFRHYYVKKEELCTFWTDRLKKCHVFFAVKDGADKLNRNDFKNPEREDEYGTSVISIQFSRGETNTLSIKNRYNHTVVNPDATFSNNLENIVPGLTDSFEKHYKFNINQEENDTSEFLTHFLSYTKATDGKYYRFNVEVNGNYYCENNVVIIGNSAIFNYTKEKERYLVIDDVIIDLQKKVILSNGHHEKYFVDSINEVGKITSIEVKKDNNNKMIYIGYEDGKETRLEVDSHNALIGYENNYIKKTYGYFMYYNTHLKWITMNSLEDVDEWSLHRCVDLEKLEWPNVKRIGENVLECNVSLDKISLPNVREIGNRFLHSNYKIDNVSLPKLEIIGKHFLHNNRFLRSINLPRVKQIDAYFLYNNVYLKELILPKVERIDNDFLWSNVALRNIDLPKLKKIGSGFLHSLIIVSSISLPSVESVEYGFLINCDAKTITLPEVKFVGDFFLRYNKTLEEISLPKVVNIGNDFLYENKKLKEVRLPNLYIVGEDFLANNDEICLIEAPNLSHFNIRQSDKISDMLTRVTQENNKQRIEK